MTMDRRLIPGLVMIALAVGAFFVFPYNLAFLTRIVIMIVLVLSLDLILGFAGIATIGQAAMYGAGAYAAGLFAIHVWADPVAGLMVGATAGAVLAGVCGLVLMRTHGLTLIMLTIAPRSPTAPGASPAGRTGCVASPCSRCWGCSSSISSGRPATGMRLSWRFWSLPVW
jgi:hypothetical protein